MTFHQAGYDHLIDEEDRVDDLLYGCGGPFLPQLFNEEAFARDDNFNMQPSQQMEMNGQNNNNGGPHKSLAIGRAPPKGPKNSIYSHPSLPKKPVTIQDKQPNIKSKSEANAVELAALKAKAQASLKKQKVAPDNPRPKDSQGIVARAGTENGKQGNIVEDALSPHIDRKVAISSDVEDLVAGEKTTASIVKREISKNKEQSQTRGILKKASGPHVSFQERIRSSKQNVTANRAIQKGETDDDEPVTDAEEDAGTVRNSCQVNAVPKSNHKRELRGSRFKTLEHAHQGQVRDSKAHNRNGANRAGPVRADPWDIPSIPLSAELLDWLQITGWNDENREQQRIEHVQRRYNLPQHTGHAQQVPAVHRAYEPHVRADWRLPERTVLVQPKEYVRVRHIEDHRPEGSAGFTSQTRKRLHSELGDDEVLIQDRYAAYDRAVHWEDSNYDPASRRSVSRGGRRHDQANESSLGGHERREDFKDQQAFYDRERSRGPRARSPGQHSRDYEYGVRGSQDRAGRVNGARGNYYGGDRPARAVRGYRGKNCRGGPRGTTRYFIIKSFNYENVQRAQEEGIWVTQKRNVDVLSEAFHTCSSVILLFSVNESKAFQGYATMESDIGDSKKPSWQKELMWPSSRPFKVKWGSTEETSNHLFMHLRNSLNEDKPASVGKDGQEIEEECGAAMCAIMDDRASRKKARLS